MTGVGSAVAVGAARAKRPAAVIGGCLLMVARAVSGGFVIDRKSTRLNSSHWE